jgi:hypothetical protein
MKNPERPNWYKDNKDLLKEQSLKHIQDSLDALTTPLPNPEIDPENALRIAELLSAQQYFVNKDKI